MKKSLGKIGLLTLLLQTLLFANNLANYELYVDKKNAMLKEPIVITFNVEQKKSMEHMFFLFTPEKSLDYKIKLLKSLNNETKKYHATASFTYLLFPLKVKKIRVKFNFTIQTASDEALAQSYIDDHDGGKAIQKTDHFIALEPLTINISQPPKETKLFGDFKLTTKSDRSSVSPHEDVNLLYTLQGDGYRADKLSLLSEIANVTLFKDVQNRYSKLTQNGYKIEKVYSYALSSTKDFVVPALHLKAYSFTKHKSYFLNTPAYTIQVKAIEKKNLLDNVDKPIAKNIVNIETIKEYLIYGVIFIFGFISAKLTQLKTPKRVKEEEFEDIKRSRTPKKLILILIDNYKEREIKNFIDTLEKIAYKQSSKSFKEVKKEILKVFSK